MSLGYEQEVIDLHQYFQDWYHGTLPNTPEFAERYANVTAPSFQVITVDGQIVPREECLARVKGRYGKRKSLRMWIENVVLNKWVGDLCIVTYEEWGEIDGQTTMFTSSAVLQESPSAPNGFIWLHMHESGLKVIED